MFKHRTHSKAGPNRFWSILFLCIAGILINVAGDWLVRLTGLPFFLDTMGTMLSAAIGGYFPGIIVGFCTNMLTSLQDASLMSYGILNILIAGMTAVFADKKYYEKFWEVLLLIPAYALISRAFSAVIVWMLEDASKIDFLDNFAVEFGDKGIAVLFTYLVLKLLPKDFLNKYFPQEIYQTMKKDKSANRIMSMRTKLLMMLSAGCLAVAGTITGISFFQFRDSVIQDHIRLGEGLTQLAAGELDAEKIDDYIRQGFQSEEYQTIQERFYQYKENYPDVHFLYVYRMQEDGFQVVFDLDAEGIPADKPGEIHSYRESFLSILPDLLAGNPVEPTISKDEEGYFLTVYQPVYDKNGICQCYVGVDFSMNLLGMYNRAFIAKVITMVMGFMCLIFAVGLYVLEHNIIFPVNHMAYCASTFSYDNAEERLENIERLKKLNISTGDEIENLYHAFLQTIQDSTLYFENMQKAEQQISEISETAMKDALTGVKNKAAYNQARFSLQKDIENHIAEFAIVMADLNHLKKVNDTFGHKKGDIYIIGACRLLCDVYKHAPVYRIGGDEFVIILTGQSYKDRNQLFENLIKVFRNTDEDTFEVPWKRYSIAAGMAVYSNISDKTVEEVFNRADKDMYDNKILMKKNRTD